MHFHILVCILLAAAADPRWRWCDWIRTKWFRPSNNNILSFRNIGEQDYRTGLVFATHRYGTGELVNPIELIKPCIIHRIPYIHLLLSHLSIHPTCFRWISLWDSTEQHSKRFYFTRPHSMLYYLGLLTLFICPVVMKRILGSDPRHRHSPQQRRSGGPRLSLRSLARVLRWELLVLLQWGERGVWSSNSRRWRIWPQAPAATASEAC